MQQFHWKWSCKCCGKGTNDWKNIGEKVIIGEQEIVMSDMFGIFKLPNDVYVAPTDGLCCECLEQLKYCYQFYGTFLAGLVAMQKLASLQNTGAHRPAEDKTTQCSLCDGNFASALELKKHRKLLHPFPKYRSYYCRPCKRSFKTNRGMLQHKSIHHDTNESYTCQMCDRLFVTKTNYQNHMRHHKDFLCNFCNAGWLSEAKLLDHVRAAHADRLFVCRFCDRAERLKKCLNRHLRASHQQTTNPFYCGHCENEQGAVYESFATLQDHLQEHRHHQCEDTEVGRTRESDTYEELLMNVSLFGKELPQLDFQDADEMEKEQEQFLQYLELTRNGAKEEKSSSPPRHTETRMDRRMVLEDFLDEAFENDEIWKKYIENGEEYLIDDYDFYLKGGMGDAGAGVQQSSCTYRCPKCDRGFHKQAHLTVHLAEGHEIASLVCNDCGASFTRLQAYRAHRKEHLKENVRFRESNIPEMEEALSLVQSAPLDYSVQEEESGYRFTCKLCDRAFQRKHNLEKHNCRFYEHLEPDAAGAPDVLSQCPHCDFRTHSRTEFAMHEQKHHTGGNTLTGPENIYCTLCDRRFSSTSGLKYHLKRHTGIKAFTCVYCGKKFTANTNLNAHIRNVHSEKKAHQCADCGEAFATKDHLNKHQRSRHRQERAFVCVECGKGYYQRSHLNEHVAACHRDSRYFCQLCHSSYVCRSSLKRHQLLKHAQDTQ